MSWWTDLWLNEGFASYMEYVGMNYLYPDWDVFGQFVAVTQQDAMALDASSGSHPVLQPVSDPADINALFDSISYEKGASLVAMMIDFLTLPVFLSGIHLYLSSHAYGNAQTADLWAAMANATTTAGSTIKVNQVMDSWTLQTGVPVVTIQTATIDNPLVLKQHRFFASTNQSDPMSSFWSIPVSAAEQFPSQAPVLIWFERDPRSAVPPDQASATEPFTASVGWVKFNVNQHGYYRVRYDDRGWTLLSQALQTQLSRFSALDRCGLLDDAFALADASLVPITRPLEITRLLAQEYSYSVWYSAFRHLDEWYFLMRFQPDYGLFESYVRTLLTAPVAFIGWNVGGNHTTSLLRSLLLQRACDYNVGTARQTAVSLFAAFMANSVNHTIPTEFVDAVYNCAIALGGEAEWQFLYLRYLSPTTSAGESIRCLRALSHSTVKWLLNRLLYMTLDPNSIRPQDAPFVLGDVANNIDGQQLAWEFLEDNWDTIFARYGNSFFGFQETIVAMGEHFYTQRHLDEIQSFLSSRPDLANSKRALPQLLQAITNNILWLENNYKTVVSWLDTENKNNNGTGLW